VELYSLLGLTPAASAADIERAYRRLVRRYHPGVNPGDRVAERMYAQVQEAYLVLGNEDRRREYDRGAVQAAAADEAAAAVAFEGFDFSAPAEGPLAATFSELFADVFQDAAREAVSPSRGADVSVNLHVSFEDAMRGCQVPLSVNRQERCGTCRGQGHVARSVAVCPGCGGEGTRRWARGHMVFTKVCEVCGGNGQMVRDVCRTCRGAGVMPHSAVISIQVPPGLESGARVAVPGHGHAGRQGGASGDLYVTVHVDPHPFLRRVGSDLHMTLPVAVHEAGLGAVVDVPVLEGSVRLRVPPGATSGTTLILRGQGMARPGTDERGDIVVTLQIALPAKLEERSRELLREFGQLNTADVRQQFFQRG
jgi:molecular chaperone DnaJ